MWILMDLMTLLHADLKKLLAGRGGLLEMLADVSLLKLFDF
jgi:hypothetical protein